jgi:hypothetical protein
LEAVEEEATSNVEEPVEEAVEEMRDADMLEDMETTAVLYLGELMRLTQLVILALPNGIDLDRSADPM